MRFISVRAALGAVALFILPVGAHAAEMTNVISSASSLRDALDDQVGRETGEMDEEKACLVEAVYYEAGSEPLLGRLAVAQVILNRTKAAAYPRTICGVVRQKGQFTFKRGRQISLAEWLEARSIATLALNGWKAVGSALFFHNTREMPSWVHRAKRLQKIGGHIFYARRD